MSFVDKTKEVEKEYKSKKIYEFYCSSHSSWGMPISEESYKRIERIRIGTEIDLEIIRDTCYYFEKNKNYSVYHSIPSGKRMKKTCWIKVVSVLETSHPDKDICFEGKIRIQRIARPKKIHANDKYKTLDEYAKQWLGYEKEGHKYGYFSNENAKWDWYILGGRWTGFFKLKPGMSGKIGEQGLMTSSALAGTADESIKRNIDFDFMYNEKLEKSIEKYENFEVLYKENPIDASERAYFEFGIHNISKDNGKFIPEGRESFLDRNATISTFAVIKDGKWYERGEMGWWGTCSKEKNSKEWNQEFKKLLDEIPEDTKIGLYDCHI